MSESESESESAGLLKIDRCWASSPVLDNK